MSSFASGVVPVISGQRARAAATRTAFAGMLTVLVLSPAISSSDFEFPAVAHSWVLLLAAALTAIAMLDIRGLRGARRLELLVLLAPAVALAFEARPRSWPIVLAYLALACLCVRLVLLAHSRGPSEASRRPAVTLGSLSRRWLVLGIAVLAVVHVGWAAGSSVRNDSAEGAVQGASRLVAGRSIYGPAATRHSSPHGDVYGPLLYEAYVSFTELLGERDGARVAGASFDLLAALLLFLLAMRVGGPELGVLATYLWLAFPLTFYEDALGFNDGLVAAALLAVLLAAASPLKRGAAAALAVWGKLSPLALLPALVAYRSGADRRSPWRFAASLLVVSALVFLPVLLETGPATFVSRTIGFQIGREPGDSLWSTIATHYGGDHAWVLSTSRIAHGLVLAAAVTLALFAYRLVRRNDLVALAAVCAAVMIAIQASLSYWSYSYVLWFVPLALVALLASATNDREEFAES